MVDEICKECGERLTWLQQYNRYYCYYCRQYPPTCPICAKDLFWVPAYNLYYCNTCMKYPDLPQPLLPPPPSEPASPLLTAPPPPPPRYSPEQIMKVFHQLKEEYEKNTKSEEEYKRLLEVFKFMDEEGTYWTIGAQSGVWYYHDGRNWVQAHTEPPPLLDLVSLTFDKRQLSI